MTVFDFIPRWVMAATIAILLAASCQFKLEAVKLSSDIAQERTHVAQLETTIAKSNADAQEQRADFAEQARKAEQARSVREQALMADANSARAAAGKLRASLAAIGTGLRAVPSTIATGLDAAYAVPDLFGECAVRYSELAEKADRHALDIQTLLAAWPK